MLDVFCGGSNSRMSNFEVLDVYCGGSNSRMSNCEVLDVYCGGSNSRMFVVMCLMYTVVVVTIGCLLLSA